MLSIFDLPSHDCYTLEDEQGNIRAWADEPRDFGPIPEGWTISPLAAASPEVRVINVNLGCLPVPPGMPKIH